MGLRSSAAQVLRRALTLDPPAHWDGWPVSWGTSWDMGSDLRAQENAGVAFACMDRIVSALYAMPVEQYDRGRLSGSPVPWVEGSPFPSYLSVSDGVAEMVWSLLMRGNAYVLPAGGGWVVLNPDAAREDQGPNGQAVLAFEGLTADQVASLVHVKYVSRPGRLFGLSPLQAAAESLGVATALQRQAATLAANGGIPSGVLRSDGELAPATAQRYKDAWSARKPGEVLVLGGGLSYESLSLSPADLALLELREFDARQVAACLGVAGWMVGLPEAGALTYTSPSQTMSYFWRVTLRPMAARVSSALSSLLPAGSMVRLDPDEFVRMDAKDRTEAGVKAVGAGLMTVNEWREGEGLPPLPGGDVPAGVDRDEIGVP